jgi:hypothetical protein
VLWRPLFYARFQLNPGVPFTLATEDFFNEYCERLTDPKPGDQVEVAWEGTFNLLSDEHVTTYEGRAWWSAVIVEHGEHAYKIHYPQWDASVWDEWVPRHRIRWPMQYHDVLVRDPVLALGLVFVLIVVRLYSVPFSRVIWWNITVRRLTGFRHGWKRGRGHLLRRLKITSESKCVVM